ncbi:hypothetical protein [Fibrobacter sp. UBA4309]|uniref:hypothetical protein n=1 Tax=Fibrobacter sp. UBA4309 TaxID=1946537 RepID=UPI0025C624BF|nr:hypothetical protein [Fibrobacter sp. UBA4309]
MGCRTLAFAWMSGLLLTLAACGGDAPSVDENFVETFVELRVAEQMYGTESPMARLARSKTLEKHGYTRETFLAVSDNILNDPHYWMPFQKRVTDRIDSVLNPEAYKKMKEEEAAKAAAKKLKKPRGEKIQ